MAFDPNAGWALAPIGAFSQSTMPNQPTPQQVAHIQAMTNAMQQPSTSPQQQTMLGGLFGSQSNLGQNLGSVGGAIMGGPAYGGGNIFTGDVYGGSAQNPLPGLTAADYG